MENLDIQLFHFINSHNSPAVDVLMQLISDRWTWIPLYLLALFFIWKKEKKAVVFRFLMCLCLAVGFANTLTSNVLKPLTKRVRPCHEAAHFPFEVHTYKGNCGGRYGFASSHAANFMAMAVMLSFFFRQKKASILFLFCAFAVSYSRIYLGVHYPTDVLGGWLVGGLGGWGGAQIFANLTADSRK